MKLARRLSALVLASAFAFSTSAFADTLVDSVTVRFYTPETGGAARPVFVTQRILAFEARLEALSEEGATSPRYQERDIRTALERHIAEEILAHLPLEREPDEAELLRVATELRASLAERVGGEAVLVRTEAAEGLDDFEVTTLVKRRARAALYIERAISPLLYPSEEQLREVYRTTPHPYRKLKFDEARQSLARWFVDERLRAAEATFLQSARTRVKIITSPKAQQLPQ